MTTTTQNRLVPPLCEIAIEVTRKCNSACNFCRIRNNRQADIPFKVLTNVLEQSRDFGLDAVRFTGGEPFLYPDLDKAIMRAKKLNYFVVINTSAPFIPDWFDSLKRQIDLIVISFFQDFSIPKKEQEQKIKKIKILAGGVKRAALGTVLSRRLLKDWDSCFNIAKSQHLNEWFFFRPMPPLAKGNYNLRKKDFLDLIDILYKHTSKKLKLNITSPVPFCISGDIKKNLAVLSGGNNSNGFNKLVWDGQGYFKPSYFFNVNLGKTLPEALAHPYLRRLYSGQGIGFCKDCIFFPRCLGGCRCWAKQEFGDYFAPDPLANEQDSLFYKAVQREAVN